MGRVKVQLKKIENKNYRHITFGKRKTGLIKKAFELSTLCDVEIALVLFSPGGRLIVFDGKKRIEEIVTRYLDLPEEQRGWVRNQEMVRRLISQMKMEDDFFNHLFTSRNLDGVGFDSKLEEIQNEMAMRIAQSDDVEKQLQHFMKNSSCIKTKFGVECCERLLEETLNRVRIRKQVLERNNQPTCEQVLEAYNFVQPACEELFYPQPANAGGSIGGVSDLNYYLSWPSQNDPQMLTTTTPNGVQPLGNQFQPSVEMLPYYTYEQLGQEYLPGNEMQNEHEVDGSSHHPDYGQFFDADLSQAWNNFQQGTTTVEAAQSMAGNVNLAYYGNSAQGNASDANFTYCGNSAQGNAGAANMAYHGNSAQSNAGAANLAYYGNSAQSNGDANLAYCGNSTESNADAVNLAYCGNSAQSNGGDVNLTYYDNSLYPDWDLDFLF